MTHSEMHMEKSQVAGPNHLALKNNVGMTCLEIFQPTQGLLSQTVCHGDRMENPETDLQKYAQLNWLFFFPSMGVEPMTSHMTGKFSTPEIHPHKVQEEKMG